MNYNYISDNSVQLKILSESFKELYFETYNYLKSLTNSRETYSRTLRSAAITYMFLLRNANYSPAYIRTYLNMDLFTWHRVKNWLSKKNLICFVGTTRGKRRVFAKTNQDEFFFRAVGLAWNLSLDDFRVYSRIMISLSSPRYISHSTRTELISEMDTTTQVYHLSRVSEEEFDCRLEYMKEKTMAANIYNVFRGAYIRYQETGKMPRIPDRYQKFNRFNMVKAESVKAKNTFLTYLYEGCQTRVRDIENRLWSFEEARI